MNKVLTLDEAASALDADVAGQVLATLGHTLHRFFHCLDEQRYDAMLRIFMPDAVWLRQGQRLQGHAAIRQALESRSKTQRIRHVISNAFVSQSTDETMTVLAYMTAYRYDDDTAFEGLPRIPGPFKLNLVSTVFRRVGARWLIQEQALTPEFDFGPASVASQG